ncbi:MAG TPA: NAD-dependent epimerase/dehydratase family protein [Actinomycetes bacterium]|nr:NAD-dependent epimerase/dehydratase family protein [Actinomycetes bacterium]
MSANHIIVGAGAVGTATARLLADSGEYVTIISRSGSGPEHPRIDRVGLDAGDVAALVALAAGDTGTAAIYNCVNPEYHRWTRDWPPIAAALLAAAEASGAVLVMTGNLYPYGPVDGAITASLPDAATGTKGRVRAQMWADAKGAHDAGRVRAVEVRGSDYLGNGAESHINRLVPRILAGKSVRVVGSADEPHSWTYVPDVARTLVTVAADERAWGRRWLVPTNPPRTQRDAVHDLCRAAGVPPVKVGVVPHAAMRALGVVSPSIRELEETRYQLVQPFVIDASETGEAFGLASTGWDEACAETVRWYRESRSAEMPRT